MEKYLFVCNLNDSDDGGTSMVEPVFNPNDNILLSINEEVVGEFTYAEAKQMICNLALKHNCGLTRSWIADDVEYWDIGPRVFNIRHA